VEVINAPLEYNLLLKHTWFYDMTTIFSSFFRVLHFPHQGKIVTIDKLGFCTPDHGSNAGFNVPFVGDTTDSSLNVDAKMFKYPSLMGIFPLTPPSPTTHISLINMIYLVTIGSIRFVYPWVVPCSDYVESSGATMPLTTIEIDNPTIPSTSINTSQQLHLHMECDPPTSPIRIVDSPSSHDSLDFEFSS
jgi:hypothetical protein